jgi:hypothetical protein
MKRRFLLDTRVDERSTKIGLKLADGELKNNFEGISLAESLEANKILSNGICVSRRIIIKCT